MIRDQGFKIKDASQKLKVRYENAKFIYRTYLRENRSDKIDPRERKLKKYKLKKRMKKGFRPERMDSLSSKVEGAMVDELRNLLPH